MKKNIKVIIAFIVGVIVSGVTVYATNEILFASSQISFDNTRANLTKANGDAVETLEDAIDALTRVGSCPVGYEMVSLGDYALTCRNTTAPICRRATTLHTEKCTNTDASYYCQADGYALNADITYGTLGTTGQLHTGDAFDCDVNGDGAYDAINERFYYVSDYFDTNNESFDNTRATLIYYKDFVGGNPSTDGVAYYASADENYHGPTTAIAALPVASSNPTGNEWRDDLLKTQDRKILSCNNESCTTLTDKTNNGSNTIDYNYTTPIYQGKAARLLTLKEFYTGCSTLNMTPSATTGSIKPACNFIFEKTKYANASLGTYGPWFENPLASYSAYAWGVSADYRLVSHHYTSYTHRGARPAIDVLYSNILY